MPSWPSSIPAYPLREGFRCVPVDNVIREKPDAGPPLSRVRFTAVPKQITCQVKLKDYTQKDALESFYNSDLSFGALTFTWAGLAFSTGAGTPSFKFLGPIDWAPRGAQGWIASMQILRLP